MSARVTSGRYDGACRCPVFGTLAQRASQPRLTSACPVPPDRGIAATAALGLADGTGKMPRAGQGRHSGRFFPPAS
jgi:hypothetical protein